MKILLIGTDYFQYTDALKGAFNKLGHDVEVCILKDTWSSTLGGKIYTVGWNLYKKIIQKPNELYRQPDFLRVRESEKTLKIYREFQPDVVVVFAAYMITPEALRQMEHCHKVLWIFDSIYNLSKIYKTLSFYNTIYTFEGTDLGFFEENGYSAKFLPLCADETIYKPQSYEKSIDVFFVGSMSNERVEFFRRLYKAIPDINMCIYGRYVGKYDYIGKYKRKKNQEEKYFTNRFLSPAEINEYYSKSKICLNIHHNQTKYGGNMRLFETLAAGGFQMVNENDYIKENFMGGVVTYKDEQDLIDKIKYYLEHDEERSVISKLGHEKVMKDDLFINRAQYILDNL